MSDQADHLRHLVRQAVQARPNLGPGAPIVVLSGGSSGVGTTTLAIQTARELARLGKQTVLVDANLANPVLTAQLNVQTPGCVADVLNGNRSVCEVLHLLGEGIHLLPSRSSNHSPPDLSRKAISRLMGELRALGSQADVVLVDAGFGMSPWVQRWWRAARQLFLVATPQEEAIKDCYLAVKLVPWGDADGKVRVVVNQCDDRQKAQQITDRFSATCRQFLGLRVEGAPPVARCEGDVFTSEAGIAYCHSVRLIATEILSHTLVVSSLLPGRPKNRGQRLADMIAVAEKLADSSNNTQTAPSK